jgi:glycosyltransferase involved in cell wall biosynthesis
MAAPRFSILTPVYETPADVLRKTLRSVRRQSYTDWELCLVDDGSQQPHVRSLLDKAAAEDARIRVEHRTHNGGIVDASNDALAMARGELVALLDHDDELHPDALALVAEAVDANPEADYLYTDEDKIDGRGRHSAATTRRPSSSPTGRRSGCGRRCTPATSACCAARWSRRSVTSTPSSPAPRTGTWCSR